MQELKPAILNRIYRSLVTSLGRTLCDFNVLLEEGTNYTRFTRYRIRVVTTLSSGEHLLSPHFI